MSRTLFRHARIWTGVGDAPWTDALLVDDGRVLAVGAEARGLGGGSDVVDLPGALVMPGLHDAHIHTAWVSRDLASVDLREAASLEETLELLRTHVAGLAAGQSVGSGRWNHNRWSVPAQPDRHSLDTVCPDRVAVLDSVDGHTMWANSLALQRAGITRDTPDPVGGEIVHDASGEPTGLLREAAQELVLGVLDDDALRPLVERCHDHLLSVGLTAITDFDGEDAREAYVGMRADGRLRLRVTKAVRDGDLELAIAQGRRSGHGDDLLRVGPVKFFSDGALGSQTAHMTEALVGHEGCGIAVTPYPVLVERARMSLAAGLDVATHAIGDEANRLVLDAYTELRSEGRTGGLRIEHAQHVRPVDVPRFRALDVIASMQPSHCTADHEIVDALIGPRRVATYAWRTFLDAGVRLAFGSDAPVEDPNPFHSLHAAVTRQRADGTPLRGWHPEQRVTLDEAVHAHTVGAHAAAGRTDAGRLAPGQLADLVCVDRDLWALEERDAASIRDARVLETVIGGESAYTAE